MQFGSVLGSCESQRNDYVKQSASLGLSHTRRVVLSPKLRDGRVLSSRIAETGTVIRPFRQYAKRALSLWAICDKTRRRQKQC